MQIMLQLPDQRIVERKPHTSMLFIYVIAMNPAILSSVADFLEARITNRYPSSPYAP